MRSARAIGARWHRILFRHLLPNTLGLVIVFVFLELPGVVLGEAFLSFLGLGINPPNASWGSLAQDGYTQYLSHPHIIVIPSVAIALAHPERVLHRRRPARRARPAHGGRRVDGDSRSQRPPHVLQDAPRRRARRRRRQLRRREGKDARHRRRVRLRQVGDGALDHGPARADRAHRQRLDLVRGPRPRAPVGARARGRARPADRDDLPGSDDVAEPDADDRHAADGDDEAASRPLGRRGAQARDRAPRGGAHPERAPAPRRLSAPLLGRHAAARDDRDRALVQAAPADRGRADDGARRDGAGGDPRPARGAARAVRDVDDHHHARHGRRRGGGRRDRGHVRGPDRRAVVGGGAVRPSGASVHGGAARRAAAARGRRRPPEPPDGDSRPASGSRRSARRVPLRAPLPVREPERRVREARAGAARDPAGPSRAERAPGERARRQPRGSARHERRAASLRLGPAEVVPGAQGALDRAHGRSREGRRRRLVRDRRRADARARRRVRLGQVDDRLLRPPAAEADGRLGALHGAGADDDGPRAICARCARRCRSSSRIRTRR